MALAHMLNTDSESLECDLAETYRIYDIEELPLHKVALFACGLRDNSRIKLKISGYKFSLETMMITAIFDKLNILLWAKSKDGQNGVNMPKSVFNLLNGIDDHKEKEFIAYSSIDEFMKARYGEESRCHH
jgi:hypothetical protein